MLPRTPLQVTQTYSHQVGDGVLIHANLPSGKTPEKRMTFVKLHMQANYLIGNNNVSLSDLTRLCNANGYRPMKKGGQKGKQTK